MYISHPCIFYLSDQIRHLFLVGKLLPSTRQPIDFTGVNIWHRECTLAPSKGAILDGSGRIYPRVEF